MALEIELTDAVGNSTSYHRIGEAHFNFDENQVTMIVKSYVSEAYRDSEKTELNAIEEQISLYNDLSAKDTLTDEERAQLSELNIQELSARKYEEKCAKANIVTFDIPQEIRDWLYNLIQTHPIFSGSTEA